jgi:phosphoglycolate phosphatase
MAIKLIIFDFDGTIADTYDAIVEIANRLLGKFGYQPLTNEELEQLKNLSSREIVNSAKISPLKLFCLLKSLHRELNKEIETFKTLQGIENYLWELHNKGYQLGIITSNHRNNVLIFLKNNHLDSVFNFIYSGTNIFGKDKIINKVIKQNKLNHNEVIYVGDETRDVNSAKKSKVKVIAVGWGFNSPSVLARYQPDFLIHHPQELIQVIEGLSTS